MVCSIRKQTHPPISLIALSSGTDDVGEEHVIIHCVLTGHASIIQLAGRPLHRHAAPHHLILLIEIEKTMELLVSFHCQCRGVKFYDLRSAGAVWGTELNLVTEPTNPHDPLCVAARVPGIPGERGAGARPRMLGHVAKEAARWLNPLLDVPSLRVTRYA